MPGRRTKCRLQMQTTCETKDTDIRKGEYEEVAEETVTELLKTCQCEDTLQNVYSRSE